MAEGEWGELLQGYETGMVTPSTLVLSPRPRGGGHGSCLWALAASPSTTQDCPRGFISCLSPACAPAFRQLLFIPAGPTMIHKCFPEVRSKCPFAELAPVHPSLHRCAQLFTAP